MNGSFFCSMEKEDYRHPPKCGTKEVIQDFYESLKQTLTNVIDCQTNCKPMNTALMHQFIGLRACIECYKTHHSVDDFISGLITRFNKSIKDFSEVLGEDYDKLSRLINSYESPLRKLTKKINKLVKSKQESRRINYRRDKDALSELSELMGDWG